MLSIQQRMNKNELEHVVLIHLYPLVIYIFWPVALNGGVGFSCVTQSQLYELLHIFLVITI